MWSTPWCPFPRKGYFSRLPQRCTHSRYFLVHSVIITAWTDFVYGTAEHDRHRTSISSLPDCVLPEIFNFYQKCQDHILQEHTQWILWKWHLLAHVCNRWWQIIFTSPHHLNLQLFSAHISKTWNDWPAWKDWWYFARLCQSPPGSIPDDPVVGVFPVVPECGNSSQYTQSPPSCHLVTTCRSYFCYFCWRWMHV